ncbi:hypothetical protein E6W39_33735 [Kitasatospora acidiphila]|uniref:Uncharacterized protein n=1 Tax=Kitasatospora acidiphila TaxID=2567942 RepID=A0A540WD00_9ACTN|nr:hypothetical protein [Kitasatospora acidiphila]TQF06274.1 hypothetical protein E6W39_33735 [Kitasatospora acidiphila]
MQLNLIYDLQSRLRGLQYVRSQMLMQARDLVRDPTAIQRYGKVAHDVLGWNQSNLTQGLTEIGREADDVAQQANRIGQLLQQAKNASSSADLQRVIRDYMGPNSPYQSVESFLQARGIVPQASQSAAVAEQAGQTIANTIADAGRIPGPNMPAQTIQYGTTAASETAAAGGEVPAALEGTASSAEGWLPEVGSIIETQAPQIEQHLPEITAGGAGTATAAGASGYSLGTILLGGLVGLLLVGGGILAYTQLSKSSPPRPPPASTAPQQPGLTTPGGSSGSGNGGNSSTNPSSFNIDGTYNGTVSGTSCVAPDCYVAVTKVSDPSGPAVSQAGSIRILFVVNTPLALNGVASPQHFSDGPMDASLQQDGTVQGSGTTTETDTTPGGGGATQVPYDLSGTIHNGQSGSPSYDLQLTVDGVPYTLAGAR